MDDFGIQVDLANDFNLRDNDPSQDRFTNPTRLQWLEQDNERVLGIFAFVLLWDFTQEDNLPFELP
ncbi:MAG: hypothetical protein CMJ50_07055 [Planctomycetaceae bacterium]|nr:hypothetical protein [Planctomycetaceae bacterium]